jgi:ferredoxin
MCRETAPSVFKRNDDIGFSVVFHQPATEAERQQAEEALIGCPVEAIGNNGSTS